MKLTQPLQSVVNFASSRIAARASERQLSAAVASEANLLTVFLPATHGSINIGASKNGAALNLDPDAIKAQGYDGVRIRPMPGVQRSKLTCSAWNGNTIEVARRPNFRVVLEDLDVESGESRAVSFGHQNLLPLDKVLDIAERLWPTAEWSIQGDLVVQPQDGWVRGPLTIDREEGGDIGRIADAMRAQSLSDSEMRYLWSRELAPGFELRAYRCSFTSGAPRGKWLVFGYNFDALFVDCVFDGDEIVEHNFYGHASAGKGWYFLRCHFKTAAAEEIKVRSDVIETAYAGPNVRLIVHDCEFEKWGLPQSHRGGGAGIVVQGGALHGDIQRCVFRGSYGNTAFKANERSHCVMISSEGLSYDIDTGAEGGLGAGNGHWLIADCAMWGHSDVLWHNNILRFGQNSGSQEAAKTVRILRCGVWGYNMQVTAEPVRSLVIDGCNTPELAEFCRTRLQMDVTREAFYPTSTERRPLSRGLRRS